MAQTELIHITVDPELKAELKEISETTGIPITEIVRRGLREQVQGLRQAMAGVVDLSDINALKDAVQAVLSDLGVLAMRDEVSEMCTQGKRLILVDASDQERVEAAGGVEAKSFHVDPESGDLRLGPRVKGDAGDEPG